MDYISVECINEFDPPRIRITVAPGVFYDIPKPFYDLIRQSLGLPDIICGE